MPFFNIKTHEAVEKITAMLLKLLVQRVCKQVSNFNHLLHFEYITEAVWGASPIPAAQPVALFARLDQEFSC